MAGIPLGPFTLLNPIGRGGMGVVWLGRHTGQGVPVAVKVITSRAASTPEYHQAFHQEVRAVSALDHPGVVWIFDYGTIAAEAARASGGELVEGSPYLVMEHCSLGTLRTIGRTLTWSELRAVLMTLLDALAHAHARGVLHRDLKPDNVLIAGADDLRPGFRLTDFGIACPLDETMGSEEKPVGTPQYMAPEQVRNETWAYGPHTDLYAFGSLAWRLAAGRLPFHGLKGASLMYAQLQKSPPPLDPVVPVPPGFEDWLRVLLQKQPHDRFRRASDAAVALAALGDPSGHGASGPQLRLLGGGAGQEGEEIDLDTATLKVLTRRGRGHRLDPAQGAATRPTLPPTWRLPPTASRPLRLMGAGLGLFGLRPIPFVARESERDELWRALAEVHHEQRARVVQVRGAAGIGKSRLVSWIADRAHEVGGANVLRVSFTANGTAIEQLRRAMVRFLRSHPMSPDVRDQRFAELLNAWSLDQVTVADAVEALLDPDRHALPDGQRHALVRRVWEILSTDRPLMVVFDDAQWGAEALKLARHLLDAQESRPSAVLVVLAVLDDVLDRHTEVARLVDALPLRQGTREIRLEPLPGEQRSELVRELLGLDRALAERVAGHTGGNPLFAAQLVGDWVEREVLVAGATGFTLRDPDAPLPGTLQEVWDGRIRQLVAGLEPPSLELLERAAVLGREVDVLEWQAAGDDPEGAHAAAGRMYFNPRHARLRHALMDRLLAVRLAQSTEAGFVFTHALFREALRDRARMAGRFKKHALACARVLAHRQTDATSERVGRLLAAAGHAEEALEPLLRAVLWRRRTLGPAAALDLLDDVETTLREAKITRSDPRWIELSVLRAQQLRLVGRPEEADRYARAALKGAEAAGDHERSARAFSVLGAVALEQGRPDEAEDHWLAAVERLGPDGDPGLALRAFHRLRRLARTRGDRALADGRAAQIERALARAVEPHDRAVGLAALAEHRAERSQTDEARIAATEALALSRELGDLPGQARAHHLLADVALARAQLAEARDQLSAAVRCLEELGAARPLTLTRCRLAWVEAKAGHFAGARAAIEPALAEGEPDDPELRASIHACLLLAAAGRSRWERFDAHVEICATLFPHLPSPPRPELAELASLAGDHAIHRHQRERAVRAWELAETLQRALGADDEAETLRRRIATLGAPAT